MHSRFVKTPEFSILLCADKKIIGKTLTENQVTVEIKPEIYGEKETTEKEFVKLLREADSINLFGEKSVALAIKEGMAVKENVKKIQGVPHIQIYRVR